MSTEEWLRQNLAAAPPLTPAQVATLSAIFAPPHMGTAPVTAITGAAQRHESPTPERSINVPR